MIFYDLPSEEFLDEFLEEFIYEESNNKIQRESKSEKRL